MIPKSKYQIVGASGPRLSTVTSTTGEVRGSGRVRTTTSITLSRRSSLDESNGVAETYTAFSKRDPTAKFTRLNRVWPGRKPAASWKVRCLCVTVAILDSLALWGPFVLSFPLHHL